MAFKMKGWNPFSKENTAKRQKEKLFNKREKYLSHSHDAGAILNNELSDDPTNMSHIKAYKKETKKENKAKKKYDKYKNKLEKKADKKKTKDYNASSQLSSSSLD